MHFNFMLKLYKIEKTLSVFFKKLFAFKKYKKNNILSKIFFAFKALIIALFAFHFLLFVVILILSILFSYINPPFTSLMLYRNTLNHYKNQKIVFIPLKNISRRVRNYFVCVEDYKFYKHNGIDIEAINNAIEINKKIGYTYFGGSTITQQLARTLFLVPEKNYLRKYMEALIALEMDLIMSKERILELYLNYVEMGKGVYGIGRASIYHYGKSYYNLENNEIIMIATILPNPIRYNPKNFIINPNLISRYKFLCSLGS